MAGPGSILAEALLSETSSSKAVIRALDRVWNLAHTFLRSRRFERGNGSLPSYAPRYAAGVTSSELTRIEHRVALLCHEIDRLHGDLCDFRRVLSQNGGRASALVHHDARRTHRKLLKKIHRQAELLEYVYGVDLSALDPLFTIKFSTYGSGLLARMPLSTLTYEAVPGTSCAPVAVTIIAVVVVLFLLLRHQGPGNDADERYVTIPFPESGQVAGEMFTELPASLADDAPVLVTQSDCRADLPTSVLLPVTASRPVAVNLLIGLSSGYEFCRGQLVGRVRCLNNHGEELAVDLVAGVNVREWVVGTPGVITETTDPDVAQWYAVPEGGEQPHKVIDLLTIPLPPDWVESDLALVVIEDLSQYATGADPAIILFGGVVECRAE